MRPYAYVNFLPSASVLARGSAAGGSGVGCPSGVPAKAAFSYAIWAGENGAGVAI